jgi:hypothetical protein
MNEEYEWENCVVCGKSEEAYFLETGFAMLLWHTEIGPMCEDCYLSPSGETADAPA